MTAHAGRVAPVPSLETSERQTCHALWHKTYGCLPPPHLSVRFMQRALAWERQAKVAGGLSAETRRALRALAQDKPVTAGARHRPAPGTRLVRDWNGRSYQVEVLDTGFAMDGRRYASLSAIAKEITGAHWSGPRFFGLAGR